jgi:hypothetical protein
MINSVRVPKFIFIKGVFKRDLITEEMMEKKMIANITDYKDDEKKMVLYSKLPNIFESIDKWPAETNLLCWTCSMSFNSIPVFIPKVIEPSISKDYKYSIGTYGVFCCFSDALAFIQRSNWNFIDKINAVKKLKFLYKVFYGKEWQEENIVSPSILETIPYGGDIDLVRFRDMIEMSKTSEEKYLKKN